MDAGDWIASTAVVVSVVAAVVSAHQAKTAKQSAGSAREQAQAAAEANQLTRQQMAREDAREQQAAAEADAVALREAQKVKLSCATAGGASIAVRLTNNGDRAIHDVDLLSVNALDDGPWEGWRVNANIAGGSVTKTHRDILAGRQHMEVAVWLLDSQGVHVQELPKRVDAEVRFCDTDGQWWAITISDGPRRIDAPRV